LRSGLRARESWRWHSRALETLRRYVIEFEIQRISSLEFIHGQTISMSSDRKKTSQAVWNAGLGTVDISPSEPIWLAGWGARAKPSEGLSQRIWVKALAHQYGNAAPCVWVTADLRGFSRTMTATIARRVRRKYGHRPLPACSQCVAFPQRPGGRRRAATLF